jgi:hypothetical protein
MSILEKLLTDTSIPQNMVELQEVIGELEDNIPDKRTTDYKRWKERINVLMREYNRKSRVGQIYVLKK